MPNCTNCQHRAEYIAADPIYRGADPRCIHHRAPHTRPLSELVHRAQLQADAAAAARTEAANLRVELDQAQAKLAPEIEATWLRGAETGAGRRSCANPRAPTGFHSRPSPGPSPGRARPSPPERWCGRASRHSLEPRCARDRP